ncbi:Uncharacterised protein [Bordetella pertussis]|nr:Uncharacterised protein [Bordetella pertussis]
MVEDAYAGDVAASSVAALDIAEHAQGVENALGAAAAHSRRLGDFVQAHGPHRAMEGGQHLQGSRRGLHEQRVFELFFGGRPDAQFAVDNTAPHEFLLLTG